MRDAPPDPRLDAALAKLAEAKELCDEGGRGEDGLRLLDEILADLAHPIGLAARECVADAMLWKSQALFDLARPDEALRLAHALADRFGEQEPPLRRIVCHALYLTAFVLRREYESAEDEVVALCRDAVLRFGGETDVLIRDRLLSLLVEERLTLESLGRTAELYALGDRISTLFRDDPDETLRERAENVVARIRAAGADQ